MKHLLITGSAGFIGSHLCRRALADGYRVTGVDNFECNYPRAIKLDNLKPLLLHPNFRFVEGDLREPRFYDDFSCSPTPDLVIHLAARVGVRDSITDPEGYRDSNVNATRLLLGWMNQQAISRLIFASSSSVYGDADSFPLCEEMTHLQPISPYAITKLEGEQIIRERHQTQGLSALCLRFFTVYGPAQRPDLAIHHFYNQLIEDKPVGLFGDGTTERDYTFIGDLTDGIMKGIDYLKGRESCFEIINLGGGRTISLRTMVDTLAGEMGVTPRINWLPAQPGDVQKTYASIGKAKRLLAYDPHTSFREGIAAFLRFKREG